MRIVDYRESSCPAGRVTRWSSHGLGLLMALLALTAIGCVSGSGGASGGSGGSGEAGRWMGSADRLASPQVDGRHPSLALATDALAMHSEERETQAVQWYEFRNDQRRSTIAGTYGPAYEREVTYTFHRRIQSDSRIHDYHGIVTYRRMELERPR